MENTSMQKVHSGMSFGVVEGVTRQNGAYVIQIGDGDSAILVRLQAVKRKQVGTLQIDIYSPSNQFASSTATCKY